MKLTFKKWYKAEDFNNSLLFVYINGFAFIGYVNDSEYKRFYNFVYNYKEKGLEIVKKEIGHSDRNFYKGRFSVWCHKNNVDIFNKFELFYARLKMEIKDNI